MIPGKFAYHAPATVPEAISLLQQFGDEAKVLAGGQSLIPMMRFRLTEPAHLVDIGGIAGLAGVAESDGWLRLGALTREATLERDARIAARYPAIADATAVIADPLVRNLATVGGNIAHADPANDHPAVMLALRAEVVAEGPGGRRVIPIDDFFVDFFTTALAPDEILVELRVPSPRPHAGSSYLKLERKVGDYAIAGVAASVTLDPDGRVTAAGIGLTNLGPKPIRAGEAEAALVGEAPDDAAIRRAADLAAAASEPIDDQRGSAHYKRAVTRTLAGRAIRQALARAG
jgi:carbon-monoxide dehydrogenase medium subunit